MTFTNEVKVSKARVAVVIGKKGAIKKRIEEETNTNITVDAQEGLITIEGEDGINLMDAREVVRAIAAGFNPDLSLTLLKPDTFLEVIDLDAVARNKNDLERIKGRIIGQKGKSWKTIEELTNTYLSVLGKKVAILGQISEVDIAKKAISQIIQGSPHPAVYRWLETQRKKLIKQDLEEKASF